MSKEDLKSKLESYLTDRLRGNANVTNMIPLSGGACQDNYLLDLNINNGEFSGEHRLVFRTDKGASLLASLSRIDEFKVCEITSSHGVKTPKPYWLETKEDVIGSPFYFMERISGKATGRYVVKDPSLNKVRKKITEELAENLAKIHKITPNLCKDEDLRKSLTRHSGKLPNSIALEAIEELRAQIPKLQEPHPAMELILNWLEKNAVSTDDEVLVHGDFRTGNFMVSPNGLEGIVDWEFAHWGDRHEDVAWLCMRDWRFGKLNKEAGGFADRNEFYSLYEKYSGIKLDPEKVTYWEIMGNIRWALGSAQQAERHLSGADKGIELAAIGRRTCEMEFEAMRLIENAG
ncbi:MAG TPA: phosphotransferase family protein [Leptospiraceae bacterium]|nr:phosphotransferase family protein [Leptospiraceae bacterium]HMW05582.1 phosphotransferase family protein [Leptospiraceae bacterium]HMY31092.1 phosphotransferase family protein [Leptospiraceae bacterium]HMZ66968.1 phosphotransferase family protein [Leptospiraceae bacterium]HNA05895.1 phosphotransferase family protein [Leptospiraceae bacterium]